ncbi:MAG: hypothetical protein HY369_04040 [Candidatus Aenigmarchaeota archaeon]|nr:hypothetical protein [Candidatus Aenigmarchaeota archaeon]
MTRAPTDGLKQAVLAYLEERFGLDPRLLTNLHWYAGAKGRVIVGPPALREAVTIGMAVARVQGSVKPTTQALQLLAASVKKNVVDLDRDQAAAFVRGRDLSLDATPLATDGYVLVRYAGLPLGCAHLRGAQLRNMLPKARRLEVDFL